nr:MAG TPA: hypothetical protein [Caudoviricetes sp.]
MKNLGQKNEQTNFFIMLIIHRLCSKKNLNIVLLKRLLLQ